MTSQYFNIIVAHDVNFGIGYENKMPWRILEDVKWFKDITTNVDLPKQQNVVIMGRKSWDSLPLVAKPLLNRYNIVISREKQIFDCKDTYYASNLDNALDIAKSLQNVHKIWVIGGGEIYKLAIVHQNLNHIYSSVIDKIYDTDTFFPDPVQFNFTKDTITTSQTPEIKAKDVVNMQYIKWKKLTNILPNVSRSLIKYSSNNYSIILNNISDKTLVNNILDKLEIEDHTHPEYQYIDLLKRIIDCGDYRQTRNSMTYSLFGANMVFDLKDGQEFPLFTTKKMFARGIFVELKFFLLGKTDAKELQAENVHVWDGNSTREYLDLHNLPHYAEGTLGPIYGYNWSFWNAEYIDGKTDYTGQGFNQLKFIIDTLIKDRFNRRILISSYNPSVVNLAVLPPCHSVIVHFGVENENELCMFMYIRSSDVFLGQSWNICQAGMLLMLVTNVVNNSPDLVGSKFKAGRVIISFGDCHIYENAIDAVKTLVERKPYPFPQLKINKQSTKFEDFEWSDFEFTNYQSHPNDFKDVKMVA